MAELSVIGASHRTAPVEVREALALTPDQASRVLAEMGAEDAFDEALLVSTCNRTEIYFVPRAADDPRAYLLDHIARVKGAPAAVEARAFYRHDDADAVRHLFRVAASLDSQIVGEHEILGQVKAAYRLAVTARTTSALLNKLLHWAFRVGKRVRTETDLGAGSASVATAAVDLARHIFSSLAGKTVLLVGAGQTAETAARALLAAGADRLIVANRTLYRAQQLAHDLTHAPSDRAASDRAATDRAASGRAATDRAASGRAATDRAATDRAAADRAATARERSGREPAADAVGLDAIPAAIARADLVITATDAEKCVLTWQDLSDILRARRTALLIIDNAVPRDVDERLGDLDQVYLSNIDDLDRLLERNLRRRRLEIPKAEAIVEYEVNQFGRWLASRQAAPTIRLLQKRIRIIQEKQIERYGKQFSDADRAQLEQFTQAMGKQILHAPLALLKQLAADGTPSKRLAAVDLVRRLFDLDTLDEQES